MNPKTASLFCCCFCFPILSLPVNSGCFFLPSLYKLHPPNERGKKINKNIEESSSVMCEREKGRLPISNNLSPSFTRLTTEDEHFIMTYPIDVLMYLCFTYSWNHRVNQSITNWILHILQLGSGDASLCK